MILRRNLLRDGKLSGKYHPPRPSSSQKPPSPTVSPPIQPVPSPPPTHHFQPVSSTAPIPRNPSSSATSHPPHTRPLAMYGANHNPTAPQPSTSLPTTHPFHSLPSPQQSAMRSLPPIDSASNTSGQTRSASSKTPTPTKLPKSRTCAISTPMRLSL